MRSKLWSPGLHYDDKNSFRHQSCNLAFLLPFLSDQAEHPILGYGRQKRDAWYAQQPHARVRELMEPLEWTLGVCGLYSCPPIAGTKRLEIGSNLGTCTAVQYSKGLDAQSSLGTVSDTSTESSSVDSPFTTSATEAAHEYACWGGALFSHRKISGFISSVDWHCVSRILRLGCMHFFWKSSYTCYRQSAPDESSRSGVISARCNKPLFSRQGLVYFPESYSSPLYALCWVYRTRSKLCPSSCPD